MHRVAIVSLALAGCAFYADTAVEATSVVATSREDHCASLPALQPSGFAHRSTSFAAKVGDPRHRGIDLIAVETAQTQVLGGKLAYTAADKDAKDEEVVLYACVDDDWKSLGATRTDRGGRFTLELTGGDRLPPGTRDLYGWVSGDGTGFRFLAYVAKAGERAIVVDIDGTITASENAVFNTFLFHDDIGHRRDSPEVLAASGHPVVYLSARGDQLTGMTRTWLRAHGFPAGPIRHARKLVTSPGPKTVAFKVDALRALGIPIHAAIGNRGTDLEAYRAAGVPADRIFIKLPGFDDEVADAIAAKRAIGFTDYASIAARLR